MFSVEYYTMHHFWHPVWCHGTSTRCKIRSKCKKHREKKSYIKNYSAITVRDFPLDQGHIGLQAASYSGKIA